MKANELRIGNYHYYHIVDDMDERKEWDEICKIDGQNIVYLEKHPDDPYYKPIPFTNEWLKRCDLKYFPFEIFGDNNRGFHIAITDNEWLFIKYIHQFQNLYFALCGEELIIQ